MPAPDLPSGPDPRNTGDVVFNRGSIYNRQRDIHTRFGGSFRNGISASAQTPVIFLFTGDSGLAYGYKDRREEGVFLYTGDGQIGDMDFVRGNRAIRGGIT
jgi:5-methylcytosine-specific restriction protein A